MTVEELSELLRVPARQPQVWNPVSRVTNDLVRRVYEHRTKAVQGFTAKYGVDRLAWFECYEDPATAISREKEIKKWRRDWKISLIEKDNSDWLDLYDAIVR
jgi:putative endonuclease